MLCIHSHTKVKLGWYGRQSQRKKTSQEDILTGRQPHRKTTLKDDNLAWRQPYWKTTLLEDKLAGRRAHMKMTSHEGELTGRWAWHSSDLDCFHKLLFPLTAEAIWNSLLAVTPTGQIFTNCQVENTLFFPKYIQINLGNIYFIKCLLNDQLVGNIFLYLIS